MPDGFDTRETWPFACLRCLHVWEEQFVVRRLADSHGNAAEIWFSAGVRVPPPWSGACCPGCGAYDVTSFPSGYLARHLELVAVPEEPPQPVFVPAARPGETPADRARLPGRLLIALGVPLVAFLAYELYIGFAAAARPHG
ncbi:hypothetical protein ABGB14_15005 [Nonomuraea sp. B10E15]|uniref:hypothetical protein n=1 Tax=unclassified Nonomuraea TaxID=2593643 RepID=UPI00325ED007